MSRLEELIAELCPDGVEYETLDFCTKKINNIKWKNEIHSFQYIDLSSVDRETHKIINTTEINRDNAPSRAQQVVNIGDILFGSTRPLLNRYCQINDEYHNQICSTGFCVLRPDTSKVHMRWIYHFLSSSGFIEHIKTYQQGASYPAISGSDIKSYMIPVPPLPIQEDIVRILDKFTELTAELTAELTKRKQQYQHYSNAIFNKYNGEREFLLKEICSISIGDFVHKNKQRDDAKYPVYNGGTTYTGFYDEYNNMGNRIIISARGANAGYINKINGKFWAGNSCYTLGVLSNEVNWNFLYYYLKNSQAKLIGEQQKGSIPAISKKQIENFSISIPPLEEQARIVAILDRFDALCNDLTSGLPAEIEARKKQYEYYRDKLLTFKEAVQ